MTLEENLQRLKEEKGLVKKHTTALTILNEILQNITGQTPEYVRTNEGTRANYGRFWYYREQTTKINMPESGDVMCDVALGLDAAADTIEAFFLTGAPKASCIPVYYMADDVPVFSFAFGFAEPKIFVPGADGKLKGKYFNVPQFIANAKELLFT